MSRPFIFLLCIIVLSSCASTDHAREPANRRKGFLRVIPFSPSIDPSEYIAEPEVYKELQEQADEEAEKNDLDVGDCTKLGSKYFFCYINNAKRRLPYLKMNRSAFSYLHPTELAAIIAYSDIRYTDYNEKLREMAQDKRVRLTSDNELEIRLLISGLNKIEGYEGESSRCDSFSESAVEEGVAEERYPEGEIIQIFSFWSTSRNNGKNYAKKWLASCRVKINIVQHGGGVMIEELSKYPDEQEVLVKPLTKFKVLRNERKIENFLAVHEIDLEEVR